MKPTSHSSELYKSIVAFSRQYVEKIEQDIEVQKILEDFSGAATARLLAPDRQFFNVLLGRARKIAFIASELPVKS